MSLQALADQMKARGRRGDTELVHMTKGEVAGLQQLAMAAGGSLTINPDTGLPEASFLKSLLPTIIGFGLAPFTGGLSAAAVGAGAGALMNKENPLMGAITGGLGAFGGGQLAGALQGAGATVAQQAAMQGAPQLAQQAVGQGLQAGATQGLQAGAAQGLQAGTAAPHLLGETAARNMLAADATNQFMAQPLMSQAGQGLTALGTEAGRSAALQSLGGASGALKTAGMAAAPAMYQSMMPKPFDEEEEDDTVLPRYDYTAGLTGNYYGTGGDGGTYERGYFTQPTFTRRAASGGIMSLAEGGATDPKDVAQGMTGASADAMRYLMGQSAVSPATLAAREVVMPTSAPTPEASREDKLRSAFMAIPAILTGKKAATKTPKFTFDPQTGQYTRLPDPVVARSGGNARNLNEILGFIPEQGSFAQGGLASLARGGMKAGGFVIPADVVSMVGEGNTDAGYEQIKRMLPGATPIKGKDGGQADTVKTSIEGKQPARIAHGEMYVPPAAVKRAGGAKKLYAMMKNVRKMAKGDAKQIKPVDLRKALA
jgi:hypothetical protein